MAGYADAFLLKMSSKNRKIAAILLPVVAGLFLGGPMLVKPVMKKMAGFQAEKASYSEKESVYKNILELDKKMQPFRVDAGKVPDKATLIEQLNLSAGRAGLAILSISPDEKKVGVGNIEGMVVRIEAEGNYHHLAEFVSQVESMKTHVRVSSLEINREAGSPDIASMGTVTPAFKGKAYKMSLSLTVYFGAKD